MNLFKIDGIYDGSTFKNLYDLGIRNFGIDCRPRSFNFLQQYKFLELIEKYYQLDFKFYLIYQNEQEFVIKKMIDDIKELMEKKTGIASLNNQFILEFLDHKDPKFYDAHNCPYFYHLDEIKEIPKIELMKNLTGIVLHNKILQQLHSGGIFNGFLKDFYKYAPKNIPLMLFIDWNEEILTSALEFFTIHKIILPINSKVEISYRVVDFPKIKKVLPLYQKYFTE